MTMYASYLAENLGRPELAQLGGLSFSRLNARLRDDEKTPLPVDARARLSALSAEFLGLPVAEAPKEDIPADLIAPLTLYIAKTNLFLPVGEVTQGSDKGAVIVAIAAPEKALDYVDDYRRLINRPVQLAYMDEASLLALIHKTWDKQARNAADVASDMADDTDDLQSLASELAVPEDLLDATDDAPIIRLINSILSQAVKEGASDIHIEPFEKQVTVRFRVDGVMHTVVTPSQKLQAAMSARLKVMAGLDIAEKRLPQDGRFKIRLAGKETDIRISTLPTQHGERIVMRLLGQQEGIRRITQIGLRDAQVAQIREVFNMPNGMFYVSGPTGSGKTSTLYAGLVEINTPDKNIVTVEDPVEYELEGLGQIPVNSKIGMTFAAGLRSILRQDPDVVVVGETRDLETAEIAIESSLTGHLVLSTIHTNDAPSTVTRLVEMGIEPFLVASSMRCVVAQRMVRVLNPRTKQPREMDAQTKALFNDLPKAVRPKEITLYEAVSTPDCPSGYQGRSGLFEIMMVTEPIRQLIHARASDGEIREAAQKDGMLTLYQEGLLRAAQGETTIEEVLRVTRAQG